MHALSQLPLKGDISIVYIYIYIDKWIFKGGIFTDPGKFMLICKEQDRN